MTREDQSQGSMVQDVNIGNKSNSSDGIILVNKIKDERDKERRIAVSNDRRYQTSNEKTELREELAVKVQREGKKKF
ncbi:hypothetical protein F8M41_012622 [Gigaspora margarita]|uniref:Uncharacterized protein n=1 Tax=Gigaspora margarita TaxID=4874 RepID=A0A8H4AT19_GIGMA|nr:hypothetical protein F8M41_012622 [Gigaspora margarita]